MAQNVGLQRSVRCEVLVVADRIGSRAVLEVVGVIVRAIAILEDYGVVILVLRRDERLRYESRYREGTRLTEVVDKVHEVGPVLIHRRLLGAIGRLVSDCAILVHDVVRTVDYG